MTVAITDAAASSYRTQMIYAWLGDPADELVYRLADANARLWS
jgi:hypothetical protein